MSRTLAHLVINIRMELRRYGRTDGLNADGDIPCYEANGGVWGRCICGFLGTDRWELPLHVCVDNLWLLVILARPSC